MPPKVRITKEEIVQTAVELVRSKGEQALNARSIASALECSTQPVFSNFTSMAELQEAVRAAAYDRYLGFLKSEADKGQYPQYKSFGMAYIRFAKEEKELFKLLFMRDRGEKDLLPTVDFDSSVEMIMKNNGFSREQAQLIHLEMWVCVHGIATILVTSFLTLEWDLISNILTDTYQGLRIKHSLEENETK